MSLKEIAKFLKDDPELTKKERFDLYYEEYQRVQEKSNSKSLDEICKELGIKRYNEK
jgi:DNA-binding CsgD family transcriptional regulator